MRSRAQPSVVGQNPPVPTTAAVIVKPTRRCIASIWCARVTSHAPALTSNAASPGNQSNKEILPRLKRATAREIHHILLEPTVEAPTNLRTCAWRSTSLWLKPPKRCTLGQRVCWTSNTILDRYPTSLTATKNGYSRLTQDGSIMRHYENRELARIDKFDVDSRHRACFQFPEGLVATLDIGRGNGA